MAIEGDIGRAIFITREENRAREDFALRALFFVLLFIQQTDANLPAVSTNRRTARMAAHNRSWVHA